MKRWSMTSGIAIVFLGSMVAMESPSRAQLFGSRSLGQPLQPNQPLRGSNNPLAAPATTNFPGTGFPPFGMPMPQMPSGQGPAANVRGNERFLRNNRQPSAFVGSDRREQSGFVGSQQAIGTGRVPAATETLSELGSKKGRMNPPLPAVSKKGIYYPRLVIDQPSSLSSNISIPPTRFEKLRQQLLDRSFGRATIRMEGTTAVLEGLVATEKLADQLALLASFEPGVDRVRNELQVAEAIEPPR